VHCSEGLHNAVQHLLSGLSDVRDRMVHHMPCAQFSFGRRARESGWAAAIRQGSAAIVVHSGRLPRRSYQRHPTTHNTARIMRSFVCLEMVSYCPRRHLICCCYTSNPAAVLCAPASRPDRRHWSVGCTDPICSQIPLADRRRKMASHRHFHGHGRRTQNHLFSGPGPATRLAAGEGPLCGS
jgi:hypothetical protein